MDTIKTLDSIVAQINDEDQDGAARRAAMYALDAIRASDFANDRSEAHIDAHLVYLRNYGAKFDYSAALKIALSWV